MYERERELHKRFKGQKVRVKDVYLPITAEARGDFEGVCLAISMGTYSPLAIVEFDDPALPPVLDFPIRCVELFEPEEPAFVLTPSHRAILKFANLLREAHEQFQVYNDAMNAEDCRALHKAGYLDLVAMGKSPNGPMIYSISRPAQRELEKTS